MSATKIEWADLTLNPVIGCSKCSPGCVNCYAEKMAFRLSKMPQTASKYASVVDRMGHWTGKVVPWSRSMMERLPKNAKRIFIGSMTDMLHENLDLGYLGGLIYHTAQENPQHTFLFLTKRAHRLNEFQEYTRDHKWDFMPLRNVWFGITICDQREADEKLVPINFLHGWNYFLSCEPLLGPIKLEPKHGLGGCMGSAIKWVICGGETGPNARSMKASWVRSLRDQCQEFAVPFFFKSWGAYSPCTFEHTDSGAVNKTGGRYHYLFDQTCNGLMRRLGKKYSLLDGRQWNEVPA